MKNSRNRRSRTLLMLLPIAVLFTGALLAGLSQAETTTGKAVEGSEVPVLAADLASGNDKVRENAAERIRKTRSELVDHLMELAKQPGKALFSPSGEPRGYLWHEPKHLAILLLGDLRASKAVTLLLENIDYRNPREFFGTSMMTNTEWYPAVEALSKIGMPAVDPIVLKLSRIDPKSKTADLCCWTLNQILGAKLAHTYIQSEIDRAQYTPEKENLKASLAYFQPR